jgi:hypothetical protein
VSDLSTFHVGNLDSWPLIWTRLCNPVLSYADWSIKDWACAYRDGAFYVFFSAFYQDEGQIRSHVVEVSTTDFQTFSSPILNLAGREDGWEGMASPDIVKAGETYYLTFNTWGDRPGQPNQLFFMASPDLVHWGPRRPLASNLTKGRSIDAALAFAGDRFYLAWKDRRHVSRIAVAPDPGADFSLVGDGVLTFERAEGARTSRKHENCQFVRVDDRWLLLATHFGAGHLPYLYRMSGDGTQEKHWQTWFGGYALQVAVEDFNTEDRANAAALYDWRAHDGHFYLFYAGNTEKRTYRSSGGWGRGWNRLGLSRSRDLVAWHPAGVE